MPVSRCTSSSLETVASADVNIQALIGQWPQIACDGGYIDEAITFDHGSDYTWRIRAGCIWGRVTATGALTLCRNTTLSASASSGQAVIVVTDANNFYAGDTISVNGVSHTISSINYSTKAITLTANLAASKAAGDVVIGRGTLLAGSEIPIGINVVAIDLLADLNDTTVRGDVRVADQILSAGGFVSSLIIGDLTQARAYSTNKLTHCFFTGLY